MKLLNKKLLILGGIELSYEIINVAKKNGAQVYVTDYLPDSPAKKNSDKNFMISTTDVDAVVNLINEEKIDGVLTGYIDLLLPYYYEICRKAKIPCYITDKKQITELMEKDNFKKLCNKFKIPVVQEYQIPKQVNATAIKGWLYPILLKPVDNSGARGIYICKTPEEVVENYPKSLEFSQKKQVLAERYIESTEATIFYVLQDGKISLSAMGDRHMRYFAEDKIPLPVAYTFPSKYLNKYQEELDAKVKEMFASLDMKNGMVFMQAFANENEIIIYEMGYRLTGSLEYKLMESINGINPLEMLVNYAITGKMSDINISEIVNPNYDKVAANITFLCKPGEIFSILGIEDIKKVKGFVDLFVSYEVGDKIPESSLGTLKQVVARAFVVAENNVELAARMEEIQQKLKVFNTKGENMLIPAFNTKELLENE